MRIGFIGAGNISKYHIEAAIEAGFKLTAICGQQNSITAPKVGLKYGFKNICNKNILLLAKKHFFSGL